MEGLCHLRLGDLRDGADLPGQLDRPRAGRAHPHYLYGFTLRELGRSHEAVAPLAEALRLSPGRAGLPARDGRALFRSRTSPRGADAGPAGDRGRRRARRPTIVTYGYVASAAGDKAAGARGIRACGAARPFGLGGLEQPRLPGPGGGPAAPSQGALSRGAAARSARRARAARNLALVAREGRPVRSWERRARAADGRAPAQAALPQVTTLALALEAPASARGRYCARRRRARRWPARGAVVAAHDGRGGARAARRRRGHGAAPPGCAIATSCPAAASASHGVLARGRVGVRSRCWQRVAGADAARARLRDRSRSRSLVEKMALEMCRTHE